MALTTKATQIVPAVWADMAQAEFLNYARVLNSAAVLSDNTLVGQPGDTITFPKWGALTDLADLTEGVAMVPEAMSTSSSTATIKEAGKAVEITDTANLTGLGDAGAEARRQFGILAAKKVDGDLIAAALAAGSRTFTSAAGGLSWAAVVGAITQFGDDWDPSDFAGLYVRSDAYAKLLVDPQFVNAATLGQAGTPVVTGQIGAIGGVPIIVTDRLTAARAALIKKNALGALYKRAPLVETDRDILKRTNLIATTVHYGVKRLKDDGVCVITLTP